MSPLSSARDWARRIKRDVVAIWFAARDPATPMAVRVLAIIVAAYALSPIDLIPDFIPVLGYLDDLVLVPLGLLLVLRLLPPAVLAAARAKAVALIERPRSMTAAAVIVALWLLCAAALTAWWLNRS
ncbi:MAG: YkvA family protein [Rhizobacter sp.]|nr:YkvA family protein [Rhizobacter sp.]